MTCRIGCALQCPSAEGKSWGMYDYAPSYMVCPDLFTLQGRQIVLQQALQHVPSKPLTLG